MMGKRSDFPRIPKDAYDTPKAAVSPLLLHLQPRTLFAEPCAGGGHLVTHLEAAGHQCIDQSDIKPRAEGIRTLDARRWEPSGNVEFVITNPPWSRPLLHELIAKLSTNVPAWLLFDADWMHTVQAQPFLPFLARVVSVGRVKWFAESPHTGKDNVAWHLFAQPTMERATRLYGRSANRDYFILSDPRKVKVGSWVTEEIDGAEQHVLRVWSKQDAELHFANMPLLANGQYPFHAWLQSGNRRNVMGFFLDPKGEEMIGTKMNLWRGYGVHPKARDPKLMLDHIAEVICSADKNLYDWLIKYLAFLIQHPDRMAKVMVCLCSEVEQTGKGTLLNLMVRLLGTHGMRVGRSDAVTGSHNELLHGLCFLYADEAMFSGSNREADILKGLATDKTLDINPKYISPFKSENYLTLMLSTNHDFAVRVSAFDARNVVIDVSPHRAGNREYFNTLHDWLESGGDGIFLHFLLTHDIDGFIPWDNPPVTDRYVDQKRKSLEGPELWWSTVCKRGTFLIHKTRRPDDGEPKPKQDGFYLKDDLYGLYLRWHDDRGARDEALDKKRFWMRFSLWADLDEDGQKQMRIDGSEPLRVVRLPDFETLEAALDIWLEGN